MSKDQKGGEVRVGTSATTKFPPSPVDSKSAAAQAASAPRSPVSAGPSPIGSPPASPPRTLIFKTGTALFPAFAEQKLQQELLILLKSNQSNKIEELQKIFTRVLENQQFLSLAQLHVTHRVLLMAAVKYQDEKGDLSNFWSDVLQRKEYAPDKKYCAFKGAQPMKPYTLKGVELRHPLEMLIGSFWFKTIETEFYTTVCIRRAKIELQQKTWQEAKDFLMRADLNDEPLIQNLIENINKVIADKTQLQDLDEDILTPVVERLEQIWIQKIQKCRQFSALGAQLNNFKCLGVLHRADVALLVEMRNLNQDTITENYIVALLNGMYASQSDIKDKVAEFKQSKASLAKQFTDLAFVLMERCVARAQAAIKSHGALGYLLLSIVYSTFSRIYFTQRSFELNGLMLDENGKLLSGDAFLSVIFDSKKYALKNAMVTKILVEKDPDAGIVIYNAYGDDGLSYTGLFPTNKPTIDALIADHKEYFEYQLAASGLAATYNKFVTDLQAEAEKEAEEYLSLARPSLSLA